MRIITISREFGSGGRELGKRLAEKLNFDYYDNEIITKVAHNIGMDPDYVANNLDDHGWRDIPLTFGSSLMTSGFIYSTQVNVLLEQKKVIEQIASLGKDCVIVGRNADVILEEYKPFNIFACATTEAKLKRCIERAPEGENLSERELMRKMKEIDKRRLQTHAILTGAPWGQRESYHLMVNTSGWNLKELAAAVGDFASAYFTSEHDTIIR